MPTDTDKLYDDENNIDTKVSGDHKNFDVLLFDQISGDYVEDRSSSLKSPEQKIIKTESESEEEDYESKGRAVLDFFLPNVLHFHEIPLDRKIVSDPVYVRSLPWRILVMRRNDSHNSQPDMNTDSFNFDSLSDPLPNYYDQVKNHSLTPKQMMRHNLGFFLQCNGESTSPRWSCYARAELWVLPNTTGCIHSIPKPYHKDINHTFQSRENDWGFTSFISMRQMLDPQTRYLYENPETGEIGIRLRIYILADPPHGADWDSKTLTGYVGLKNQGATCYMNSLLQALFFTNALRKAVYSIPVDVKSLPSPETSPQNKINTLQNNSLLNKDDSDDSPGGVALALQRVFYELQYGKEAVGTRKLTRSFGWQTLDSFMQHDAQELCRVLLDNLETKMKLCSNENVAGTIPKLFSGKMCSYIRCKKVEFESSREENFYDIQLKVKGNKDVYEAFEEYIEVESLEGDNKYDAGEHGMQDAEKGVKFLTFPPVLYLHLMRFQYDYLTDSNVKINDKFEFPYRLDLRKFMQQGNAEDNDAQFILHAVLVHSGDHHGGHYVVYINPQGDGRWFKFDDDVVSSCTSAEAIQMNYGGGGLHSQLSPKKRQEKEADSKMLPDGKIETNEEKAVWSRLSVGYRTTSVSPSTNAYMLIYVKESAKNSVLASVEDHHIPSSLRETFLQEQQVRDKRQLEMEQVHLFTWVNIYTDKDVAIAACQNFNVLSRSSSLRIKCAKSIRYDEFKKLLGKELGESPECIFPWIFKPNRIRDSRRLMVPLDESQMSYFSNIDDIWCQIIPHIEKDHNNTLSPTPTNAIDYIFSNNNSTTVPQQQPVSKNSFVLLFIKFYTTFNNKNGNSNSYHNVTLDDNNKSRTTTTGEMIYVGHVAANVTHSLGDILQPFINKLNLPSNPSIRVYFENESMQLLPCEPSELDSINSWKMQSLESALTQCKLVSQDNNGQVLVFTCENHLTNDESSANETIDLCTYYKSPRTFVLFQHIANYQEVGGKELDSLLFDDVITLSHLQESMKSSPHMLHLPNDANYTQITNSLYEIIINNNEIANKNEIMPSSADHLQIYCLRHSQSDPAPLSSTTRSVLRELLNGMNPLTINMDESNGDNKLKPTSCVEMIHSLGNDSIASIAVISLYHYRICYRFFYRVLDSPIHEVESQRSLRIPFLPWDQVGRASPYKELTIHLRPQATVRDLLEAVCVQLNAGDGLRPGEEPLQLKHLRLWEVYRDNKLNVEITGWDMKMPQNNCNMQHSLRVDEIPPEERQMNSQSVLLRVAHYYNEPTNLHGVPFTVHVQAGDTYRSVAERIRQRLDVSVKEFSQWKVSLVTSYTQVQTINVESDAKIPIASFNCQKSGQTPWIGLDHRPAQKRSLEKAIKIHN